MINTSLNQRAAALENALVGMAGYGLMHMLDVIDDEQLSFDFAQIESEIAHIAHVDFSPLVHYHPDHINHAKRAIINGYRQRIADLEIGKEDWWDIGDFDQWMRLGQRQDMYKFVLRMVENFFSAYTDDELNRWRDHYSIYWTYKAFPSAS